MPAQGRIRHYRQALKYLSMVFSYLLFLTNKVEATPSGKNIEVRVIGLSANIVKIQGLARNMISDNNHINLSCFG